MIREEAQGYNLGIANLKRWKEVIDTEKKTEKE